jgi:transposase
VTKHRILLKAISKTILDIYLKILHILGMDLTNEQWARLKHLIPSPNKQADGRERPRREPKPKDAINGILGVLRTGAPWKDMPPWYPPYQTCHRWFQKWCQDGVLKQILSKLAEDLYERGGIDIRETFIDGSSTPAKKGAVLSAIQSAAKAPRSWQLQTLLVFLSPLTYKAFHPTK